MSTHEVKIMRVGVVSEHPNADKLEITHGGGWQVVVQKGKFKTGDLAIYIPPDFVIPTAHEEFAFLAREGKDDYRLKAIRLRGEMSYGLLIHVPFELEDAFDVGDNVMNELGIKRYIPKVSLQGADTLPHDQWPADSQKFDVENLQNYADIFQPDEQVVATEKVHGANTRYRMNKGVVIAGTRTRWLKDGDSAWHRAAKGCKGIAVMCKAFPAFTLYGEIYGPVQSFKYGRAEPTFIAFAIKDQNGHWLDRDEFYGVCVTSGIPTTPVLYRGPFRDIDLSIAEQDSVVSLEDGQVMEGVVITPVFERVDPSIGRVAVKHISDRYWTKK